MEGLPETADGSTIVTGAGPEAVLAAIAQRDAKLGLIFLQMGRTAEWGQKRWASRSLPSRLESR